MFGQWLRGQVFLGLVVGIATFIGLEVLSLTIDPVFGRFAVLLSVIAGVLELLPIIGPIIAAIPAVILGLTAGVDAAIAAVVLYALIQQIENHVLVPKIQGDAVELHPTIVIMALVIGGAIAGIFGAIFAVPITAAARDLFRYAFHRVDDPPATPDEAVAMIRASEVIDRIGHRRRPGSGLTWRPRSTHTRRSGRPEAEDEVGQAAIAGSPEIPPDRQPDDEGVERMVAINAAWELLRDPARRAAYDASLASATRPPAAAPVEPTRSAAPPPPTRPTTATGSPSAGQDQPRASGGGANRPPETVSRDWTSGRSGAGGGYDASTMGKAEGRRGGPPPGNPSGDRPQVRALHGLVDRRDRRTDLEGTRWLDRMSIGRAYRDEIDQVLRRAGRRRSSTADATDRHGLFRRR